MKTKGNRSERILSKRILVWIIIGMLGFGVIAVNGGLVLSQHQGAQNAAEAASFAGALALIQGYNLDQIRDVVMQRAREQGFDTEAPGTTVKLSWMSDIVGAGASFSNDVRVAITTDYTSIFSAILNSDKNAFTVDAVAHARIDEDFAPGYAVVSLNDEKRQDIGGERGAGYWGEGGTMANANPIPVTSGTRVSLTEVPLPDCSGLTDYGEVAINSSTTLEPGKYMSITVGEGASLNMNPGLYCIYGAGADDNSFLLANASQVMGQNVMLYLMEDAGNFSTSPSSAVYLNAPENLLDPSGRQWAGMLLYAHEDVNGLLTFTGTSKTMFKGTIYAPGAYCETHGTKGFVTLKSQIVCDIVTLSEIDGLHISYDMSMNYHLPEAVEIMD